MVAPGLVVCQASWDGTPLAVDRLVATGSETVTAPRGCHVEDQALAAMIRNRMTAGTLPRDECTGTWYGFGNGRSCSGCDRPIAASDVEVECDLSDGTTVRFHRLCFDLWGQTRQATV
jgi:hypothetical protein